MLLNRRLNRFSGRIDALALTISEFDSISVPTTSEIYIIERAVVQLQIEWEHFVRDLILDSATGRFEDSNGGVRSNLSLLRRTASREQVSHILIANYRRRKFEPNWYLPVDAIQAASKLKVSNFSNISLNLGISPWEINSMRSVRNFIVHRSKRSALELRGYQFSDLSGSGAVPKIVKSFSSGGRRYYELWTEFMKFVASKLAN